jgi:hypothetical protein
MAMREEWNNSDLRIWKFQVLDGLKVIDEAFVPIHQMGEGAAYDFLRALVVRAMALSAQEAAAYFVNRRQGPIEPSYTLEKQKYCEPSKLKQGFWISDSNIHGITELRMSPKVAQVMELQLLEGRRSHTAKVAK